MRVVIFGIGKMYQKNKSKLRKDIEIVALIDNDFSKQGSMVDGIKVFSPSQIMTFTYDFIFLLSAQQMEMKEQLLELGVQGEKIFDMDQMERICESKPTKYFGKLDAKNGGRKILFFSHALTLTGAQNVMYIAVQTLQKWGYQLVVLSKQDGVLKDRILSLDVPVVIMENPHSDNKEFMELVQWADIVFVNTIWLYYMVEELLCMDKKTIWWIHEAVGFEYLSKNIIQNLKRSDMLSAYAVSPLVKRRMISIFGKELNIKELTFGLPAYQASITGAFHQKKKVFALIGAIGWIKGQDLLIQAVAQMPEDYRNKAEFWIVGRGKLAEADLKRAQQFPCLKLIGEIENSKMPDLYSQIDAVVCCSREESMSVVVIEGCMNEKPVIVSDAAGIADYIMDGEDGLLFQSENVDQLVSRIEWVIDHAEQAKAVGRRSKRIYERYFHMELFENRLLEAIAETEKVSEKKHKIEKKPFQNEDNKEGIMK